MFEAYGPTDEVDLILGIAHALRREFGTAIDAQPGGAGIEAGPINRAFLATSRHILQAIVPPPGDLSGLTTWVLRFAARGRLLGFGIQVDKAEALLDSEPTLGDSWLVYLTLASKPVIEDALSGRDDLEGDVGTTFTT